MTIASEITRLQWSKSTARASIINKWVDVPVNASVEDYHTYIDQIEQWVPQEDYNMALLFDPQSFILLNQYYNTSKDPSIHSHLWDIVTADYSTYYRFFWLMDTDTTAYQKYRLSAWKKAPLADPIIIQSWRIASDRFYFRSVAWRMKRVNNGIKFSVLYYEWTSSSSSSKDHYYCANYNSSTNTFTTADCWIIDDIWQAAVYANWTNNCWITAEESISAINKVNLSLQYTWVSNYFHLKATLNN